MFKLGNLDAGLSVTYSFAALALSLSQHIVIRSKILYLSNTRFLHSDNMSCLFSHVSEFIVLSIIEIEELKSCISIDCTPHLGSSHLCFYIRSI